ncbi:MAG: NPCBM/NEW2 domain-containing protein [Phycisphaerae bacterium]
MSNGDALSATPHTSATRGTSASPAHDMSASRALRTSHASATPSRARARRRSFALGFQLALAFGVALALRAWIVAQPGVGHGSDLGFFARWTRGLAELDLAGFFRAESFCDYPPLMLLLFQGLGTLLARFGDAGLSDVAIIAGVKSLTCLADLAIGLLLFIEARRLLGAAGGVAAATLYLLNPLALYNGAYWGQVDAVYTALVLAALIAARRQCWRTAGVFAAAALGAKFQSIAFLPLIVFEAYRAGAWRAVGHKALGFAAAAVVILAPFAFQGVLSEALQRSYVHVVGQYHELSRSAFNVWFLGGATTAVDTVPPAAVLRLVADGRDEFPVAESRLLHLTWRRISLVVFALSVAVVLSLYSLRPGAERLFGAAGLLGLCFFLFPTEMHERYAFPVIALLAIWAAARRAGERVYWLLSALLLLNVAAYLPAEQIAAQLSAANLAIFAVLVIMLLLPRHAPAEDDALPARATPAPHDPTSCASADVGGARDASDPPPRALIRAFRVLTALALVAALGAGGWIATRAAAAPPLSERPHTIWLSDLNPRAARQGWKTPARNRTVEGGFIQLGKTVYLRGVGTHAPGHLVYEPPPGADWFETIVGIDAAAGAAGSARVYFSLDGKPAAETPLLTGGGEVANIRFPVAGAALLTIRVDATPDGQRADHVDLALARFTIADSSAGEGRLEMHATTAPHRRARLPATAAPANNPD